MTTFSDNILCAINLCPCNVCEVWLCVFLLLFGSEIGGMSNGTFLILTFLIIPPVTNFVEPYERVFLFRILNGSYAVLIRNLRYDLICIKVFTYASLIKSIH